MELAQRINCAHTFLKNEIPSSEITEALIKKYGVSRIQAYRYIRQAKKSMKPVPVPEPSVVFTVKLEPGLIKRVKEAAASMGLSISKTVKMALEEFLAKPDRGKKEKAG